MFTYSLGKWEGIYFTLEYIERVIKETAVLK